MIHLTYRFRPTSMATSDPNAFWAWVQEREKWFCDGLDTVQATQWRVCTVGRHVHTLEHVVSFADEAGWGHYRRQVAERERDPQWQARRVSQDRWWQIEEAQLLSDPPVPLGLQQAATEPIDPGDLTARSRYLIDKCSVPDPGDTGSGRSLGCHGELRAQAPTVTAAVLLHDRGPAQP